MPRDPITKARFNHEPGFCFRLRGMNWPNFMALACFKMVRATFSCKIMALSWKKLRQRSEFREGGVTEGGFDLDVFLDGLDERVGLEG